MKAYILASGMGSRLRPLTEALPKPMVPVMNQPLVDHLVAHLAGHVDHIRLNVSYRKQAIIDYLANREGASYFDEGDTPIGSARTLGLERAYLASDTTLVVCGDVLCDWDVEAMVRFHRQRRALATIAVRRVADPSRYGVVITDPDGRVRSFQEKPRVPLNDLVNCGIYLFSAELVAHWNLAWRDIGGCLLPALAAAGAPLYAWTMNAGACWDDVGTLESYLQVHLERTGEQATIAPGARVAPDARLVRSVVGAGAQIGSGARLERCVVWPGARVEAHAALTDAIVTPQVVVPVPVAGRLQVPA